MLPRYTLPVAALLEHVDQGVTIDEFSEWFSSVRREQMRSGSGICQGFPGGTRGGRVKILFDANSPARLLGFWGGMR